MPRSTGMRNEGTIPSTVVHNASDRTFRHISVLLGTRLGCVSRTGTRASRATTPGRGRSLGTLAMAVMAGLRGWTPMAAVWEAAGPSTSLGRGRPSIIAPRWFEAGPSANLSVSPLLRFTTPWSLAANHSACVSARTSHEPSSSAVVSVKSARSMTVVASSARSYEVSSSIGVVLSASPSLPMAPATSDLESGCSMAKNVGVLAS